MASLKELALTFPELVAAQNYPALADALNFQPLHPNPVPQEQVPAPITLDALRGKLTRQEKRWILKSETLNDLLAQAYASSEIDEEEIDFVLAEFSRHPTGEKPLLVALLELAEAQHGESLAKLCGILLGLGKLSTGTHDAVLAAMATTVPDPEWQPEVRGQSLAQENGLPTVTARQVREALNA